MKHNYQYYRVFSIERQGGNGACVFEDKGYTTETKQKFAQIIGLSEIVFVSKDKNDFRLQYFTPNQEIEMCGHATLAAIKFINHRFNSFPEQLITKESVINVKYSNDQCYIDLGEAEYLTELDKLDEIAESMSINIGQIGYKDIKAVIYKSGIADILLPVENHAVLKSINLKRELLIDISKKYDVVGLHAFTIDNGQVYARNFAPLYDIDEEYATGTSNNSIIYLLKSKIARLNHKGTIIQGVGNDLGKINYMISDKKVFIGGDITKEDVKYDLF